MADSRLGMDRQITRRDFMGGVALAISGSMAWRWSDAHAPVIAYPPALMGLRGSHVGSFEVAHQLAREGRHNWGPVVDVDGLYDLVVVGGGVSGLSAAFFYLKAHPQARILVLDNHDDFGGHAKRNEFVVGDRKLITHGGSELLEGPENYNDLATGLFRDLGIEPERLAAGYKLDFYREHRLSGGIHFDRQSFGADRTLAYPLVTRNFYSGWIPVAEPQLSGEEAVKQMPLSNAARLELLRLLTTRENTIGQHSFASDAEYLNRISYKVFLQRHMKLVEPEVYAVLENLPTDWCVGIEAVPAI